MELVAAGHPGRDEALVRVLHRRLVRLSMVAAGENPNEKNLLFYRLDPILK
jgi:hypothetical protein